VQNAEAIGLQKDTELRSHFSTNFSSAVLKTSCAEGHRSAHPLQFLSSVKNRPNWGGPVISNQNLSEVLSQISSARNFFQKFLIDVKIGMYVLHIVIIFERFEQANHLRRLLPFQLDVIIWNHTYT
jgi:hypothetical protein